MIEYQVPNYIALAIPFFFVLIFIELIATRILKRDHYRISDSINDLSMGTLQQITGIFTRTTIFAAYLLLYDYLWQNFRLIDWGLDTIVVGLLAGQPLASFDDGTLWRFGAAAVVGFLLVDMAYYWFHRTSHEVAVVWGSHEAHHQSEEYNLTVALRQGFLQFLFSWPFNLPIALLGIHPAIYAVCAQFNTIYQFWIHTRSIKKMPTWFEAVFNTPSHHRVHHAIDPKYIDRNHAGTLIIWDRMFGTFQAEEEEPHYGTVKPLASWNPLWAQVQYWVYLAKTAYHAPYWADKFKIWFMRPGWKPRGMRADDAAPAYSPIPEVNPTTYQKYDPQIPRGLSYYCLTQFAIVLVCSLTLLAQTIKPLSGPGLAMGAWVVFGLLSIGLVLEGRRAGRWIEASRQLLTMGLGIAGLMMGWLPLSYGLVLLAISAGGLVWLAYYRNLPGPLPAAANPAALRVPTAAK